MQRFLDALSRLQQRHALLLFLALGALLFALEGRRHRGAMPPPPQAAGEGVTAAQWLEDEVLYREAMARGLDDGDVIVRRRLVQKMRQLLETSADVAEPDAQELRDWIDTHAGRYGGVARLSLDHVFLSRSLRTGLAADAATVGARLRAGTDAAGLGDPHPAGSGGERLGTRELERVFGSALVAQLGELPAGSWQGPLASALGLHYVRIRERSLQAPDYAAVRDRARRDYLVERRREATRLALHQLKARYGLEATATP